MDAFENKRARNILMRKLKVLIYGNVWSKSGGTKTFSALQKSDILDIYFGAPIAGSLSQYDVPDYKFIYMPSRTELLLGRNNLVAGITSKMDIVIDCLPSTTVDPDLFSILYHSMAPINILHSVFGPDRIFEKKNYIDAYFCVSLDVMRNMRDLSYYNELIYCLPCMTFEHKYSARARDDIRSKFSIPQSAFVVGSTLTDDTLNRSVMTEFVKRHPETYYITTTKYEETDRFGCRGIPPNFRCIDQVNAYDVDNMLTAYDVFLHTRTETFGSCVFEALSANLPVVARWTGSNNGFAECIYPNGGYLAGHDEDNLKRSIDDCVLALEYIYKNYAEAKGRAKIAHERTKKWLDQNIIPQFEKLFLTLAVTKNIIQDSDAKDLKTVSFLSKDNLAEWRDKTRPEIESLLSKSSFI